LWIVTLIFFRYTFVHMAPEDLTPPYWINMGAVAMGLRWWAACRLKPNEGSQMSKFSTARDTFSKISGGNS
jgi:hypothetical protein